MSATEIANEVEASRAIQDDKHVLWLRQPRCIRNGPANISVLAMKAWQWGLGIVIPQLAQRLNPFLRPALYIVERVRGCSSQAMS
jgi:hypothetical protein